MEASKGGCATDISVLSESQAVQRCVPSSVHFGVAQEQLTPYINSESSNILLHPSPRTYQRHQATRGPMSGTEGGSSDTGGDVLVWCLMDVRWSQLGFLLRWAASLCISRGGGDRRSPGDKAVFQQNQNQAMCWENGFVFLEHMTKHWKTIRHY